MIRLHPPQQRRALADDAVSARHAEALDKPLYNQPWHAESGFSQHKRRLGSALTTRHDGAQGREIVLRVITHNPMLIAEAR